MHRNIYDDNISTLMHYDPSIRLKFTCGSSCHKKEKKNITFIYTVSTIKV